MILIQTGIELLKGNIEGWEIIFKFIELNVGGMGLGILFGIVSSYWI